MTDHEIFDARTIKRAKAALSDSEYRRKYSKIDLVDLADQQKQLLNSQTRFTYAKAGNQAGKTETGAFKVVCTALGRFPSYYTGYRAPPNKLTNRPYSKIIWCLAPTSQVLRDAAQTRIFGDVASGLSGTGLMPAERIVSIQASRGIAGGIDTAIVRADDGSLVAIRFKSYEAGREAAQSEAVDLIWCDEMLADMSLWNELLARTTATSGEIWLTATPKKQQSPVALWFKEPNHIDRGIVVLSTRKTKHLSDEQVEAMAASYSPIERRTRIEGEDYAGGGLVLHAPMDEVGMDRRIESFPTWVRKIVGFDPSHGGLSESAHPAGVALCVFDDQSGVFYVVDAFREKHLLPEQLAARILRSPWGNAPVAWGAAERAGTGKDNETYADMFKRLGLRMLPHHATLPGGGYGLDPSFDQIQQAMSNGTFKINRHLIELWDEIAGLERDDDNRIIPIRDDILSAMRYAYMMKKFAKEVGSREGGVFASLYRDKREQKYAIGIDDDPLTW